MNSFIESYSSWNRLKRGVAWFLKYKLFLLRKVRHHDEGNHLGPIKGKLLVKRAEKEIVVCAHREAFQEHFSQVVKSKSPLRKLCPILIDGILCIGGRLQNAPIPTEVKHPVLPKKHHVTDLIVRKYHEELAHAGREHVLSSIRQKFWIVKGRVAVRRVLRECLFCRKRASPTGEQKMADLPSERLTPDRPPFTFVGIDYFGPFLVRLKRSSVKRYGCLFTCLASRAVHIEISHSLDTNSFIDALRRFISRRGGPEIIRSDNGTNFHGGERELRSALSEWNQQKINAFTSQREINPPTASHMGGVWERIVQSVKRILKALLREQLVNDESLLTLMAETESVINSRPLTLNPDDPIDAEPLTPSHLLLLRSNQSIPPGVLSEQDQYCQRRWRQIQYLANIFWKRWLRQYLITLQQRHKWSYVSRNLKMGDLVLLTEENTHRGQWPFGRVTRVHKAKDGHVRSVEIKTKTGSLIRPITKLCFLENFPMSA